MKVDLVVYLWRVEVKCNALENPSLKIFDNLLIFFCIPVQNNVQSSKK